MTTFARVLSVAIVLATSSRALAHPMEFGVMSLDEIDRERYELELRFSGSEESPTQGAPWIDDGCTFERPIDVPLDWGVHVRGIVRCPGGLVGHRIGVAGLEGTEVEVPVTIRSRRGDVQTALLTADAPRYLVLARPSRARVFAQYVGLGVEHIAIGLDHLLLVLGLLLASRSLRQVLVTVSSFTVGHSLTLALASLGFVHVPGPPVEACIALSLVLLAVELLRTESRPKRAWLLAVVFGLLHGLGFASALASVGLPSNAIGLSLFGFNVGVELGQVAFIGIAVGVAALARAVVGRDRVARLESHLPELVGALATYFLLERLAALG